MQECHAGNCKLILAILIYQNDGKCINKCTVLSNKVSVVRPESPPKSPPIVKRTELGTVRGYPLKRHKLITKTYTKYSKNYKNYVTLSKRSAFPQLIRVPRLSCNMQASPASPSSPGFVTAQGSRRRSDVTYWTPFTFSILLQIRKSLRPRVSMQKVYFNSPPSFGIVNRYLTNPLVPNAEIAMNHN